MVTRMSPADAVWYLGENRVNPMTISSIMWFDRPLDVELFRERVEDRLLAEHPIMRERIVPSRIPGLMPRWVDGGSFDLDHHVTEHQLPSPGDHAALQDWCSEERRTPLDRSRPLWHVSILQGYRGEGSAAHVRIHHSIGDGLAMMQLLFTIVDEYQPGAVSESDPSWSALRGIAEAGTELVSRSAHLAMHPSEAAELARQGMELVGWAGRLIAPQLVERTVLQGHPEGRKLMVWDPEGFPLDEVRHAARASGATINDLVMTVMSGALHRYLTEYDAVVDDVAMMIPVNLRRPGDALPRRLGNRIGLLPVRLPVRSGDPRERLTILQERMRVLKESPAPVVSRMLLVATTMLTPVVERGIHRLNQLRSTGVLTNVPGPREPLHIGGAQMLGTVGWGGMTAHLNLSGAFISLNGRIFPGFVTDASITPDPEEILQHVHDEYTLVIETLTASGG
jgi:diacylglycerol O-acyltransferase / wax synthase